MLQEQKHFRMHEELTTAPSFYYLYDKADGVVDPLAAAGPAGLAEAEAGKIRTKGVEPWHQQHWDWKAAGNFMGGGTGSGLFTFVALAMLAGASSFTLGLLALALVALGLFLVWLKIGRPWRFIYVLRQPQRSWMAREAWIVLVFFPLAAAALWFETSALIVAAAIVGLLFLYCQAMILKESKGIPAWRVPLVVPLTMMTGLGEGGGLFLVAATLLPALKPLAQVVALVVLVLVMARWWVWRAYFTSLETGGVPTRTLEVLTAYSAWFVALGLAVPAALVALGFFATSAAPPLFVFAGTSAFASGWALKFILITRAAYNQGFALKHTPVRGSGVPGHSMKPGWSLQ